MRNNTKSVSGMWRFGLDRGGSGYEQMAGSCESSNEPSGPKKCGEFLDLLKTGQLLKDSAAWSKQVNTKLCLIL
jgi:hypothetical protein